MKTLFASALIALTLSTAPVSFAQTPTPFRSVIQTRPTTMKVDVTVEKSSDARLTVAFVDADGHTLATQTLTKGDTIARTRFDVASLPDGFYKVIITDGTHTETKEVTLQTPTMTRTLAAL